LVGWGPKLPRSGLLSAMDPTTNKIVWQHKLPFMCGGGSGMLTTASGLLFTGQSDGFLVARDATTGEVLWRFQTGAGADAPASTYEVNGEQYVAILAGGNQFQQSQSGDYLWAFKLGGTVPALPNPRTPGPPPIPTAAVVDPVLFTPFFGTYELGEKAQIAVSVENGQLALQPVGAPNTLLFTPSSETTFFRMPPLIRIEFVKDAQGVVTHMTWQQGNQAVLKFVRR
jgi:hypothetical protein